ncbi:MAG: aminopeptidase P family protein [Promethearchaeota archaeon]|nr:MAG: aminopeptidase P family protein [Candidatus Lokiarchaeota archaeon]
MSLERINRIRSHEKFVELGLDGILITKPENVLYILGFKVESDVVIFIPREDNKRNDEKILVFFNELEYDQARKFIEEDKSLSNIIEITQIPREPNFIYETINKLELNSVGFEDDYISVKRYNEWNEKYKIDKFVGSSEIINGARKIKTDKEIEAIRRAGEIGDLGFKTIFDGIEEGKTEYELVAEAEYVMRKAGSEGIPFDTIVASGENSAYPHAKTTNKKVQDGDIIIVDIGARFGGYCSDMTRTFIFGKISKEKVKLINLVNDAQQYGLDNIKAGVKCSDIDKIVREFFINKNKEWGARFLHSLGHGVGIDIHENPYLSPLSQDVLEENMVVTVEPGLYVNPGLGGARTEDQILITKNSYIPFTHSKKMYY